MKSPIWLSLSKHRSLHTAIHTKTFPTPAGNTANNLLIYFVHTPTPQHSNHPTHLPTLPGHHTKITWSQKYRVAKKKKKMAYFKHYLCIFNYAHVRNIILIFLWLSEAAAHQGNDRVEESEEESIKTYFDFVKCLS